MATISSGEARCSGDPARSRPGCNRRATHLVMSKDPVDMGDDQGNPALLLCEGHYGRGRLWLAAEVSAMGGRGVVDVKLQADPVELPPNVWVLEAA